VPAFNRPNGVQPRFGRRRRRFAGLATRDIAVDLGTANTLVYVRGEGIVVSEPSVVAIDNVTGSVHAVGEDAKRMIGRTPAAISAIRPLRHGVIADFEVTEKMLRHFLGRAGQSRFVHPRVVMCAPSGITGVERRAVEEACVAAGARRVHMIEEPMAAAIGAGLDISQPRASMVVDVGGGTSEVAVISLGGIVVSRAIRVGGYDLDEAIAAHIRRRHNVAIGAQTAEEVKLEIGTAWPVADEEKSVRGRDLVSGLPRNVVLTSAEVRGAFEDQIATIVGAVKETLEETPPELAADIVTDGIMLAGGGSLLRGFKECLEAETHMPIFHARSPLTCVVVGAGRALDEYEALERTGRAPIRAPSR
jgi:rod shape-determining protein MreB